MAHSVTFRGSEAAGDLSLALIRTFGIALLLAAPVAMILVWPSVANPFMAGKTHIFRECVFGAGICALLLQAIQPRYLGLSTWLFAGFVAITGLADWNGIYPFISFSGTADRLEGFLTPVSMLAYAASCVVLLRRARDWRLFLSAWALSGVVAAASGLYQIVVMSGAHMALPRIWGVSGQPVFLGSYLALGALLALWLALDAGRAVWGWWAAAAFQAAILFTTGTRSAMLGLIAGLITAIYLMQGQGLIRHQIAAGAMVITTIAALAAIQITGGWWPAAQQFDLGESLSTRLGCWHAEMTFIHLRPWLGYGQEGLRVYCGPQIWDRAHNFLIQILADGGIAAATAYLLFLGRSLGDAWRARGGAFAAAAIIAYTVIGLAEPMTIMAMVLFMTVTAWAAWNSTRELADG